jgi:hypothetical protein
MAGGVMQRLLLASMVLLGAELAQFSFVTEAQGLHADDPDIKAIRDVVELYISGDADKIRFGVLSDSSSHPR